MSLSVSCVGILADGRVQSGLESSVIDLRVRVQAGSTELTRVRCCLGWILSDTHARLSHSRYHLSPPITDSHQSCESPAYPRLHRD